MATTTVDFHGAPQEEFHVHRRKIEELTQVMTLRFGSFYGTALGRVRNIADAEDAVQDAFLSAYTHLHQFKGTAKMSTWLTTIVINSANTIMRRRSRKLTSPDSLGEQDNNALLAALSDPGPTPEEAYGRQELVDRIATSLQYLSPTMRRAVELRYVHGLSIRETADAMGLTDTAAKVYLSRARSRLRRLVHESSAQNERAV